MTKKSKDKKKLENKINVIEKRNKQHKQFFGVLRMVSLIIATMNLFLFFRDYEINNLVVSLLFIVLIFQSYLLLKQERSLISNLYEWLTNKKVIERKDIAIHNMIEMFFTLKEDIRTNILARDEIYDRILEITTLINSGDIINEDCFKKPVDNNVKKPVDKV